MGIHQKVVWAEGMLLNPHHFQQWDRYYDQLLSARLGLLQSFGWGVAHLDIDRDGVANGRFSILQFTAVMADGIVVQIPDPDGSPDIRPFGHLFPASKERLDVYLGIPIERPDRIACQLDGVPSARPARYRSEEIRIADANTGDNVQEVLVTRKNLKVHFSGEEVTDMTSLKIAEVIRNPSGLITLNDQYIPPCLWLLSGSALVRCVRGLVELLTAKRNSFSDAQRGVLEMVGADLAKFVLVHAISSHLPVLHHLCHVERIHPETLYRTLASLAGELMILDSPGESIELPPYNHEEIGATVGELDRRIRRIIEGITPTRHIVITLESTGDNIWVGRVSESRLFESAEFFLSAAGEMSEDQIRSLIPQHVKVGPPSKLKDIVSAAMPGVRLYHTARPPVSLPMKSGTHYFRLDDRSAYWDDIKKAYVIALHVPQNLQALNLQLVAAKD